MSLYLSMIGIITGDIINSRKTSSPEPWLKLLKAALKRWGQEPGQWEIYRGDSFQLEVQEVANALKAAIYLKATIKTLKQLDVRMAVGIGEKNYAAENIREANGPAFVRSGERFERLKKEKQSLAVETPSAQVNDLFNLCLKLALIAMDHWTPASAEFVKVYLENEGLSQKELGEILGISQSSVSERFSRAYLSEILELQHFWVTQMKELAEPEL